MLLSAFHSTNTWVLMKSSVGLQLFAIDWLRATWQTRLAWINKEKKDFSELLKSTGLSACRFDSVGSVLAEVLEGHADVDAFDAAVDAFKKSCLSDLTMSRHNSGQNIALDCVMYRIEEVRDYAGAVTELRGALLRPD